MKQKIIYAIVFLNATFTFFLAFNSYSQKDDAGLWLAVQLKKPLTAKFELQFRQMERFNQNITRLNLSYSDIGAAYSLNKYFQATLNYRFINKFDSENGLSVRNRFYCNLIFKKKLKPFVLVYRQRFQYQLEDNTSEKRRTPDYYTRSKLTIKYDLNRFTPYIASELYIKIVSLNQSKANRYRAFAGCNYKINKTNNLNLYYLFEKHFNQKDPLTNYIIGITYEHTFY